MLNLSNLNYFVFLFNYSCPITLVAPESIDFTDGVNFYTASLMKPAISLAGLYRLTVS